jgi:hypothetical protein
VVARTGPSRWCDQVAVTRVHFSHQNADYWSLLLHHFAPRSGPPVRVWGQGAYLYLYLLLSLSQRSRTAPAQQTVSRYVLCLILVGNTDHIIVIVQSRGRSGLGGGAQLLLHWLPTVGVMVVVEDVCGM